MRLFISYRRTDSDIAGRISDRMIAEFGQDSVFLDVDNIPVGRDFRTVIDDAICGSDCVLLVIGPGWIRASMKDPDDAGNLNSETDFVRIEVKSALDRKIPIIPVLVGGVNMPDTSALPADIAGIAFINATEVRSGRDYHQDISSLLGDIHGLLGDKVIHVEESSEEHTEPKTPPLATAQTVDFDSAELITHPKSLIGRRIGRYKLSRFIASGGGGAVYEAVDTNLSNSVCLKVAYPVSVSIDKIKSLVAKGVKGIVEMRHPGVVRILDFDSFLLSDQKLSFFITLELLDGCNLEQWSQSLGSDNAGFLKRLACAAEIATILSDAHKFIYLGEDGIECVGVLHGDIKSNNILMANGTPRLLDFMLIDLQSLQSSEVQQQVEGDEAVTMAFGTPTYMADEQALQGVITRKTDIYSLGITLCRLFSPEFNSHYLQAYPGEILAFVLENATVAGTEAHPEARQRLLTLIVQCTTKEPATRPESMEVIAQTLKSILDEVVMEPSNDRLSGTSENAVEDSGHIDIKTAPQEHSSDLFSRMLGMFRPNKTAPDLEDTVLFKVTKQTGTAGYRYCSFCGKNNGGAADDMNCRHCGSRHDPDITHCPHSCGHSTPFGIYCRCCGEKIGPV